MQYRQDQDGPPYSETPPAECSNGHPLGPHQVIVGWLPCNCAGEGHAHDTLVACPTKQMRPGIQQAPRICRGALRSGSDTDLPDLP